MAWSNYRTPMRIHRSPPPFCPSFQYFYQKKKKIPFLHNSISKFKSNIIIWKKLLLKFRNGTRLYSDSPSSVFHWCIENKYCTGKSKMLFSLSVPSKTICCDPLYWHLLCHKEPKMERLHPLGSLGVFNNNSFALESVTTEKFGLLMP